MSPEKSNAPPTPNPAFDANCNFEYVTDAQFDANGFQGASQASCGSLTTSEAVDAELTGLIPGTEYHLRLAASNAGGTDSLEAGNTFTTLPVANPTVAIDPVATHADTTATFTGTVATNAPAPPLSEAAKAAFKAEWNFECSPACPGLTSGSIAASEGSGVVSVQVTDLEPNTSYEVKLVATNAGGSGSAETSFQTTSVGPLAKTFPAFALAGGTEAILGGEVNPKNAATSYWVEYGPGPGGPGATYSDSVPVSKDASAGSAGQPVFVTQKVSGLNPASTYHYRLTAKNAAGTTEGEDVDFESAPLPSPSADCPNAKLRAETSSAALPECRAYEIASAVEKNGGDATGVLTSTTNGDRVAYLAPTAFANAPANAISGSYMAQRGSSGWSTRSMVPPVGVSNLAIAGGYYAADFSSDLSKSFVTGRSAAASEPNTQNTFSVDANGNAQWITAPTITNVPYQEKAYSGHSADGSHVIFESSQEFVPGVSGSNQVYEWFGGQVRLVSELPTGGPVPGGGTLGTGANANLTLGTNFVGTLLERTAVSADGSRIFFSAGRPGEGSLGVYVREDGVKTRELSLSQRTGSVGQEASAIYVGASVDGSWVYMRSPERLTNDAAEGGGLYSYNLVTDKLHFVASTPPGEVTTLISDDGSRAYFLTPEQLIPGDGVRGQSNLYTANDEGNDLAFVATLSGEPAEYFRATPDGGQLTFESNARLTSYDNSGHREVYLYNVGYGSLHCVSCAPDGQAATGDAALHTTPETTGSFGSPRAITDDGRVVFQTNQGLVAADVNGIKDVYEYDDGRISLISTGTSLYPSEVGDNSADGNSIFFGTRESLVGQDIDDGANDVYDARVDGGYPAPVPAEPCEGEAACQRQPSSTPAFTSPGTASLAGRGNPTSRGKGKPRKGCKQKSKKQRAHCVKAKKGHQSKKHDEKKASKSGRGK